MFEYYQNTLCVASTWLVNEGLISQTNLKNLVNRGKIKKLTIGGNGRKALLVYESIPDRFKKLIRDKEDPYASVKNINFRDYMVWGYQMIKLFL